MYVCERFGSSNVRDATAVEYNITRTNIPFTKIVQSSNMYSTARQHAFTMLVIHTEASALWCPSTC